MTMFGSYISNINETTKLIVLAAFVQVLDVLTFLLAYQRFGITGELNPFAVWMYEQGGLTMIVGSKFVAVGIMVALLGWVQRKSELGAVAGAWAMLLAGLAGMIVNTAALMI